MKHILIIGAASDVAMELAKLFAEKGFQITLAARNVNRLDPLKNDLAIRFEAEVNLLEMDVSKVNESISVLKELAAKTDVAVSMVGYLGDQNAAQEDLTKAEEIMAVNYNYPALALSTIASVYEKRQKGTLIGVSSVAGERGRMSNYFYGSSKAGFTAFLSGLRNRLAHAGVHVMTVKPGFMYTKMTEDLELPAPLTIHPDKAARLIYKGYKSKKNVIYIAPIWRLIMLVIKTIPEIIFKKLKL